MEAAHSGFQAVGEGGKARRVRGAFDPAAPRPDLMNDLMSGGLHRLWKACAVMIAGPREGDRVLDIAGGMGDLALAFSRKVGPRGEVVHTDIDEAVLRLGRDRLIDRGAVLPTVVCDAERLPFPDGHFDLVSVAFGLHQMAQKDRAIAEMARVLKDRGRLLVLDFSRVAAPLKKIHDLYSFQVLPRLSEWVTGDARSYRHFAESIRRHPGQEELKSLMQHHGFGHVDYHNLTGGVAALHVGVKC